MGTTLVRLSFKIPVTVHSSIYLVDEYEETYEDAYEGDFIKLIAKAPIPELDRFWPLNELSLAQDIRSIFWNEIRTKEFAEDLTLRLCGSSKIRIGIQWQNLMYTPDIFVGKHHKYVEFEFETKLDIPDV